MITLDAIPLPSGLVWTDEFDARAVAQTMRRTLSGGIIVFHAPLTKGRTITLLSEPDAGWASRSTVQALLERASTPGAIYTLNLRGVDAQVMFAHHEPPALQATPVLNVASPGPEHPYLVTLKLITV